MNHSFTSGLLLYFPNEISKGVCTLIFARQFINLLTINRAIERFVKLYNF